MWMESIRMLEHCTEQGDWIRAKEFGVHQS
jgi:hypothetical protein